jgi:acyl-CoA thioesterase FadM
MYPFLRMMKELWVHRHAPPLDLFAEHESRHLCWPWDLDPWAELNNGRTLTLYDLGRIPMARRMGLGGVMRAQGWGLAVAGASVRYRRRVRAFDRLTMRTRLIGWDARFLYMEQAMWRGAECTSHILLRSAITGLQRQGGLVPPADLARALGRPVDSPPLPAWVRAWIAAEDTRPWPPMAAP